MIFIFENTFDKSSQAILYGSAEEMQEEEGEETVS